jgi:hypothetical protein
MAQKTYEIGDIIAFCQIEIAPMGYSCYEIADNGIKMEVNVNEEEILLGTIIVIHENVQSKLTSVFDEINLATLTWYEVISGNKKFLINEMGIKEDMMPKTKV